MTTKIFRTPDSFQDSVSLGKSVSGIRMQGPDWSVWAGDYSNVSHTPGPVSAVKHTQTETQKERERERTTEARGTNE